MSTVPPFVPVTPDVLGGNNDIPSWFQIFLRQYNTYGIATSAALNGALDLESNIVGMYYPASGYLKVTTGPKYVEQDQFTPISFGWLGYQHRGPRSVSIGICNRSDGAININPLSISSWGYSSTTRAITINFITGLEDSTTYYFTFVAN